MSAQIVVIKRNGEQVPFEDERVIHSMQRSGVPVELQDRALQHIKERVQKDNTITTDEIFYHIREFLVGKDKKSALRFNLRQGIFDLGPTGFPFEKYLAEIFQEQGYRTQTDLILKGDCVDHEIDILLEKEDKKEIVEVKFHNQTFGKTDVQVALYVYARFLDLQKSNNISGVWIATNTKLSVDAIHYSKCKGIKMLSWNYPPEASLAEFVEKPKMYPLTVITDLTQEEKRHLIDNGIVLAKDLLNISNNELKAKYLVDEKRIQEIKNDAKLIANGE